MKSAALETEQKINKERTVWRSEIERIPIHIKGLNFASPYCKAAEFFFKKHAFAK